jgi:Flp pilus assembly protein TadG
MWGSNVKSIIACLRRLVADTAGNVLPLAGVGVLVLAAMIGGGLDMSRGYMAQSKLQQACDAGVLAARKAVATNGFDATVKAQGTKFFDANFYDTDQNTRSTSFVTTSPDNGLTVNGTAKTTLDTLIMRIFNYDQFDLSISCTASMGVGNSDVTFVLDTTGSMGWTASGSSWIPKGGTSRLTDLKAAMKNFYTTLKNASAGSNARIRYGFVPYSSSVNVGKVIYDLDPSYLADSMEIQSRRGVAWWNLVSTDNGATNTKAGSTTNWVRSSDNYSSSSSCNSALPDTTDWKDDGSPSPSGVNVTYQANGNKTETATVTQSQFKTEYACGSYWGRYYIYFRKVYRDLYYGQTKVYSPTYSTMKSSWKEWQYRAFTIDTSQYKTFTKVNTPTGDYGATVSSTWGGCIEERQTTPASSISFSATTGMSPDTWDLDIDTPPDGSPESKWRPMWPQMAYVRTFVDQYNNVWRSTDPTTTTGEPADTYCPKASQLLTALSETEFNTYVNSLSAAGSTYHDLGMLWGARISSPTGIWKDNVLLEPSNGGTVSRHIIYMTDGEMSTNSDLQTTYGIEIYDRRITTDGSNGSSDARHTARFLALCEATKAKGIRVWVVAFGTSLTSDLSNCASENSAYSAASSAALNTAFQQIAKQVGELRITQ